jgi:hypothetical protein
MEKMPEERSAGDFARDIGRAAVSLVPVAGGPLQVLLEAVFGSPLEKRKQEWLQQLAGVVDELQARIEGLTPEKLAQDDAFVTVALQATQAAVRNHRREKIDALRNAVLNAAIDHSLADDDKSMFVRLVDQLTPWHLQVLAVLDDPVRWMERHKVQNPGWSMGAPSTVLEHCLPELRGQGDTCQQIVRELQAEGLVGQGQFLNTMMTAGGMVAGHTTPRGKAFIRFITAPA